MNLTKNILKTYIFIIILSFSLFLVQNTRAIASSDFVITSSYNITLEDIKNDFVTVQETFEIQPNNVQYYIPADSEQTILTKKDEMIRDTLKVQNKYGQEINYQIKEQENNFQIVINNKENITRKNPFFIKATYQTQEFINQNGNITNLYLPGLHEDIKFEEIDPRHNIKTTYEYYLDYNVPIDSPKPSSINPQTISYRDNSEYRTYTFPQESRINKTGWIQLGDEQYYYFKIHQKIPQTNFLTPESLRKYTKWVSTNILELALPKEFTENNQEVFFTKVIPEPQKIKTDEEGNIIGVFEIEAYEDQNVIVEGYIKLSKNITEIPDFSILEYKQRIKGLNRLELYTQPDTYWEADSPEIQQIAKQLLSENEQGNIMQLIKANYNFVIDHLEYSKEKAKAENIRVGALKALQGAESVCMEYADLLIAIFRAQGIPAKAAFGYGNDPLITDLTNQVGHQWVQVWYPDYGWLSIDPTWGETGREYIGGDLDHLLWYTVASSEEKVTDSAIYSADPITAAILEHYDITITPLHETEIPDLNNLKSISDLIFEYQGDGSEPSQFEYTLKTTILGRALIFLIPIVTILIAITTITVLISKIFKTKNN